MTLKGVGARVVRYRAAFMMVGLLLTIGAGILASDLRLHDDPNAWPPDDHPNVRLNNRIQESFGGANLVSIMVTTPNGGHHSDVFNIESLTKIKRLTERLRLIDGVIPYTINSIASINTKYMRFIPGGGGEDGENAAEDTMEILPLMDPSRAPKTAEDVARIKEGAFNKNTLAEGFLVSPDGKSARILADFRTQRFADLPFTDPVAIYRAIQGLIEAESDANHVIRASGTPIIIGWVNSDGLFYVGLALLFFVATVSVTLWLAFRNVAGVILPLMVGLFGSVAGFALYRMLYGEVLGSASALIAPFIVIAVAAFHAVQFLKRFFDQELSRTDDVAVAAVNAFAARFKPMLVSLLADVTAFAVLAFVPFENVRVLGLVTTFGMCSVTIAEFLLLLPALSFVASRRTPSATTATNSGAQEEGRVERWVRAIVTPLVLRRRVQVAVGCATLIVVGASLWSLRSVTTSQDNTYAIHNYLTRSWVGNPIYEMEMNIRERFGGVYPLTILVEAQGRAAQAEKPLQDPHIMQKMDAFAAALDADPAVHGVTGLPVFLKAMNRFMTGDIDENFIVPTDARAIGTYFFFYTSGQPGSFDAYADPAFESTVMTAMVEDTKPETVARLMENARSYVGASFNDDTVKASVGGGSIGIADAFNESIGKWLLIGTILSASLTLVAAAGMIRSFSLAVILLLPLIVATIVWLALMRVMGIEMNSNTVTSLAIASGIGIDAGVYCLYRFREETAEAMSSVWNDELLISSFVHIFRPLAASNAALVLGCWALIPIPLYLGYVGFGMGLILLLTSVASFVLLPVLWSVLKPKDLLPASNETARGVDGEAVDRMIHDVGR